MLMLMIAMVIKSDNHLSNNASQLHIRLLSCQPARGLFCSSDDFSKNHIRAKGSSLSLFLNNLFYLGTHCEVVGISRRMFVAQSCLSFIVFCLFSFGSINCRSPLADTQICSPTVELSSLLLSHSFLSLNSLQLKLQPWLHVAGPVSQCHTESHWAGMGEMQKYRNVKYW